MPSKRKYDIVIFGATGACGRYCILEIIKYLNSAPPDHQFTWAVAARSMSKITSVLLQVSKQINKDLSHVDKILADITNPDSLRSMARQADVVLNFVGPYLLYGEATVKACIEEGTHHLDMSAEDQYLEEVQLKYNKAAEENGSYVIGAAGLASILSDCGSMHLDQNFKGELNSVDSYVNIWEDITGIKPPVAHIGTYHSILLAVHQFWKLEALKTKLFPEPYFEFQHKTSVRPLVYSEDVGSWCVSIPIADARVMDRTQRYKFYQQHRQPAQTRFYAQVPNLILGILLFIALKAAFYFLQFKLVLKILLKYPKIFSLGFIGSEGEIKEGVVFPFVFTLVGNGWGTSERDSCPPNKKLILKIQGNNATIEGTVAAMLQAGITILKDRKKMPLKGGVYTPGIAFAGTGLVDRLSDLGITFTFDNCIETSKDK